MDAILAHLGYLAIVLGVLIEGETVLVAAGALAHRGDLSLPLVMLAAFASSVFGDQLWFHVGARYGTARLARHARLRARADVAERWLAEYGTLFVVGFRFLYGLRTATPLFLGATRYPVQRFTVLNTIGAALWVTVFATLGWAVGATLASALRRAGRLEEIAAAALVIGALVGLAVSRARRTRRTRPSWS